MTMLYISPLIQETEIGATVMPLTVHHTTKCSILLSELFCMPYFSFSAQHHGKCSYVSMHTNHLCFKIKIEKKYIKKTSELTTGLSSKLYQLLLKSFYLQTMTVAFYTNIYAANFEITTDTECGSLHIPITQSASLKLKQNPHKIFALQYLTDEQ